MEEAVLTGDWDLSSRSDPVMDRVIGVGLEGRPVVLAALTGETTSLSSSDEN